MRKDVHRLRYSDTKAHLAERRRSYQLRREREIGNWGRASEHVGRRWEELGLERLAEMLRNGYRWPTNQHQAHALVPLMSDGAIQSAITRMGLPSPDVVVVLANCATGLSLQALDFKWDIEFASYDQIRAGALEALLRRDQGVLREAFARAAGQAVVGDGCIDGFLFAPDSPANRHFLSSVANQRREYPIETGEVIFAPVEPEQFFAPLPGWDLAVRVADLDRATPSLRLLDSADRYYRLGAGLMGAVTQLRCSIFERDPQPAEAGEVMAWFQAQVRPLSSATMLGHVESLMAVRSQQLDQLRRLTRLPYRFADLARALSAKGIVLPDHADGEPPSPDRERWRGLLRRVGAEYRSIILRTGRRLVGGGLSDAEALARLSAEGRRHEQIARTVAERMIESELGAG